MKIQEISVRDFRGVHSLDFRPGFLNIVTGPNGSGKTSLGAALGWWASGKTPWTMENGYGFSDVIRRGAESTQVSLTFDSPEGEVSATRQAPPHKLALSGTSDLGINEAQARLNQVMGCPGGVARLALEPGKFFELDSKKRNALLSELLGLMMTPAQVEALLVDRQEACGLPLVETAKALGKGRISNNFGQFEQAAKAGFTAAGQEIKAATERKKAEEERLQALLLAEKERPPAPTRDELQAARDEERHTGLMLAKARNAREKTRALTEFRDTARQAVDDLRQEIQDIPDVDAARASVAKGEKALADREASLEEALQVELDRESARKTFTDLRQEIAALDAALEGGTCRECGGSLPAEVRATLEARAEALTGQALEAKATAKAPDRLEEIADLRERIKRGRVEVQRRRDLLRVAEGAEDMRRRLARAERDLQEKEARLVEHLAETHGDEESLTEWHAAAEATLADLESRAGAPGEVERCQGQIRAYEQQIADAEKRRKILGELKWWFGPDGIQKQHLQAKIAPVLTNVNAILARWGYEVDWDQALDLTVRTPATSGKFVPVSNVSDAEWILVALAHQVWLAAVTGIRIVVVDRVEAVDEPGQAALLEACLSLQDQLDHVFLLGVEMRCPLPAEAVTLTFTDNTDTETDERKAA